MIEPKIKKGGILMLNENIRAIRKSKGLSQQELAIKLNVVRQTVSKWEKGLSVPDSDMLLTISKALETPVSILLGETVTENPADDIRAIAEKLEVINLQLAKREINHRKLLMWFFAGLLAITVAVFTALYLMQDQYLNWNWSSPETAVLGTLLHAFEWAFVRLSPFICIGSILGMVLTGKRE